MPSFCPNYTGGDEVLLGKEEKLFVIIVYSCLAVLAIGGNVTVIFIVCYFPKMRASTTNYFIINLACADMLMALMCIPFSYWPTLILQYWPFGPVMCKLISFSKVVSILLSAHTLSVISIDRLVAVLNPLRRQLTQCRVVLILCVVWIMDMIIASPMLIVAGIVLVPVDANKTKFEDQCSEKWHEFNITKGGFVYSSTLLALQYFLPLCIMCVSYGAIGCKLWLTKSPGECAARVDKGRKGTTKKIIMMMLLVSIMYAICYLPQNAFNLSWTLCEDILRHPHILYIWWGCHYVAMLQCSLNPIIYVTASQRYREGFTFVFQWCPCVRYAPHHLTASQTRTVTVRTLSTKSNAPWHKKAAIANSTLVCDDQSGSSSKALSFNKTRTDQYSPLLQVAHHFHAKSGKRRSISAPNSSLTQTDIIQLREAAYGVSS